MMNTNGQRRHPPKLLIITDEAPYSFYRDNVTQELKMKKRDASGQQTAVKLIREIYQETEHFCALVDSQVVDDKFDECVRRIREIDDKVQVVPIPMKIGLLSNNLKNSKFWPVYLQMEERIENLPNEDEAWKASIEVNKRFAEAVLKSIEKDHQSGVCEGVTIVWIQDFRFWLTPKLVREMMLKNNYQFPIGTFIHIPFAPPQVLQKLKHCKEVIEGILGSDVVCFNMQGHCINFAKCCEKILGCQVDYESLTVHYEGRKVTLHGTPVGINHDFYANLSRNNILKDCHNVIADLYRDSNTFDHKIIIGIDRLDYCKGLEMKVKAFQILLEKYAVHNGKVQYLQVAVPVRTNQPGFKHLPLEYKTLVAQTNDSLQENGFSSRIHVVLEEIPHHHLPMLYRNAHVGFVTPYRDGLNLVALEYVASQTSDPGVLVLSNCAGAAEFMHEALKVCPRDVENVAETLHHALTMPVEERQKRMRKLKERVKDELDINHWAERSLEVMLEIPRM